MQLHQFYRQYEDIRKGDRFEAIATPPEATSLFVIFQQLTQVRAQRKFFEDREKHLLFLAELGFNQLKDGNEPERT